MKAVPSSPRSPAAYSATQLRFSSALRNNTKVKPPFFKGKSLKVRIRGRDDVPLRMSDFKQGLFELARRLEPYGQYRIKSASLYLTVVDEHGDEVSLARTGQWSIFPYECAADRIDPPQ
jgi:hypothetical protein